MMNESLLHSESIFIPLDSSANTLASQDFKEDESDYMETQQINRPPISLTQEEAMRLLHIATSIIQSNFRKYSQQKRYKDKLRENKAATKIQALWRGYRTRNLDVKVMQVKHEHLVSQFQSFFLTELETKSIFSSSLLTLAKKVEELSLPKDLQDSTTEKGNWVLSQKQKPLTKDIEDIKEEISSIKINDNIVRDENEAQLSEIKIQTESNKECEFVPKEYQVLDYNSFEERNYQNRSSPVDVKNVVISLVDDDDD